jgi:surface antigen
MVTLLFCVGAGLVVIALLGLMVRLSPTRTLDPADRREMDAQQARATEAGMYGRISGIGGGGI